MIVQVRASRRGFVLIATCVAACVVLAFGVLVIDIARMRVIKSELQAFTDADALNAALELDGTEQGIRRARIAAVQFASGPNAMRWDMGTQPVHSITTSFANSDVSSDRAVWSAQPQSASGIRFVRVQASAPAPVVLIRMFQSFVDGPLISVFSVAQGIPGNTRLVQ